MATLLINISDHLHSRLEARAFENGFPTVESYVGAMLLADAAGPTVNDAALEPLLLSRLDGPFVNADAADFQRMREKLNARLAPPPDA